ncbi:hypothetical protein NPIL_104481, partial [Nephila pilipes]
SRLQNIRIFFCQALYYICSKICQPIHKNENLISSTTTTTVKWFYSCKIKRQFPFPLRNRSRKSSPTTSFEGTVVTSETNIAYQTSHRIVRKRYMICNVLDQNECIYVLDLELLQQIMINGDLNVQKLQNLIIVSLL